MLDVLKDENQKPLDSERIWIPFKCLMKFLSELTDEQMKK